MYKTFKVEDVLTVEQTKSVVAKKDLKPGDIPYVTRTVSDNGYNGTCGNTDKINKGNCITIGAETGTAFYQPNDFVAGNKIYRLSRAGLGEKEYLFLAAVLNKQTQNYSYSNARIPEKIKKENISLPIHPSQDPLHTYTPEDINWEYMEQRISELEEQRISELEEYLRVTGLDDYELTEEDKKVLSLSRKSASYKADAMEAGNEDGRIKYKSFTVGELFISQNGDTDIQKNHITSKGTCVVSSGLEETGIIGKSDVQSRIIPSNTITVDMFGNAFFRDFEYKLVTHARVFSLIPKSFELTRESGLFITALLRWLPKMFSYANMCSFKKIKDFHLFLPVTSDGSIDFDYMQKYIRALEKLTIANAVREKDRIIAETRNIVDTH